MSKGKGNITVNNRESDKYFTTATLLYKLNQPFSLVDMEGKFDVEVNVSGGGITGQVEQYDWQFLVPCVSLILKTVKLLKLKV